MRYAVIGTGAIGGYYGGRLAHNAKDVHFLLRSDYTQVSNGGMRIDSVNGGFTLEHPYIYNEPTQMPKADVVLVCLKTTALASLPQLVTPILKEDTIVILIVNGIGVEEDVQNMLPSGTQLVAGMAFICSTKIAPGHISHQDYGPLSLASYSCRDTNRLNAVIDDFNSSDVPTTLVDYKEARWKKAIWNMPFNGLTVVMGADTHQILSSKKMRSQVIALMEEVVDAARADGVTTLDHSHIDTMIELTDHMTPYAPSTKVDYDRHRTMELYYLYTRPIEIARTCGAPMLKMELLEAQLYMRQELNE